MTRDTRRLDDHLQPRSSDERSFFDHFDGMFNPKPERSRANTEDLVRGALHKFIDGLERGGSKAIELTGRLLAEEFERRNAERAIRAQVLTGLARIYVKEQTRVATDEHGRKTARHEVWFADAAGVENPVVTERSVHHVGALIGPLFADDMCRLALIEWSEDMALGAKHADGSVAVEAQPIAVIRGAFFSQYLAHVNMAAFWDEAARDGRFPLSVFSEPCRSDKGVILSVFHVEVIARILSGATPRAARAIAAHVAKNANHKRVAADLAGVRPHDVTVPANAGEREHILRAIHNSVVGEERRALVQLEFFNGLSSR